MVIVGFIKGLRVFVHHVAKAVLISVDVACKAIVVEVVRLQLSSSL